jgi:hypothetical protein
MIYEIRQGNQLAVVHQKRGEETALIKPYFDDKLSELTPITANLHLPKAILEFITLLKPNSKGLFDKSGTIYVEMNMAVLHSAETFEVFLNFYHSIIAKFPTLKPYTALYEKTVNIPWDLKKWALPEICEEFTKDGNGARTKCTREEFMARHPTVVTSNIYIQVRVMDMLIETLTHYFRPEDDFPISDALTFCLEHGISDNELMETFNVPTSTYYRLKSPIPKMGKSKQQQKPSERTDLAENQN